MDWITSKSCLNGRQYRKTVCLKCEVQKTQWDETLLWYIGTTNNKVSVIFTVTLCTVVCTLYLISSFKNHHLTGRYIRKYIYTFQPWVLSILRREKTMNTLHNIFDFFDAQRIIDPNHKKLAFTIFLFCNIIHYVSILILLKTCFVMLI